MANLLADLAAALSEGDIETPPDGWYTARDMAKSANKGLTWAQKLIQRGVAEGLVEQKSFRIRSGGRVVQVPHYKVIE
jgi:hypothetical protein